MRITKQFRICEVRAGEASNAPFQIILLHNVLKREEESSLTLDINTCARYNIPMSLDLVGYTLICSFESRELPFYNNGREEGRVDTRSLRNDELQILSLKSSRSMSPVFYTIPPSKYTQSSKTLELSSFGGGDSMHMHIMPCPSYRFIVELTDEEYEACNVLPANSVFKANFYLK